MGAFLKTIELRDMHVVGSFSSLVSPFIPTLRPVFSYQVCWKVEMFALISAQQRQHIIQRGALHVRRQWLRHTVLPISTPVKNGVTLNVEALQRKIIVGFSWRKKFHGFAQSLRCLLIFNLVSVELMYPLVTLKFLPT